MSFAIDVPFDIKGGRAKIVVDEVGETAPTGDGIRLVKPGVKHTSIWVRESVVQAARAEDPAMKVFGFWQSMFAADLIDPSAGLYVLPLEGRRGLFLYCEGGIAILSGQYVGENYPARVQVPITGPIRIDQEWLANIRLPSEPARTLAETAAHRRANERKRWAVTGALCLTVIGAAAVAEFVLQKVDERKRAEAQELNDQAAQLGAKTKDLELSVNEITPESQQRTYIALTRLAEVLKHTEGLEIPLTDITSADVEGKAKAFLPGTTFPVGFTASPSGAMKLRFSQDGTGDAGYVR